MARRRRLPYLLVGVLLVLGCAGGGVVVAAQLGHREQVLALARPVTVGQQLSPEDLREVSISADTGLSVIRSGAKATVEGRPVAYSLPAGALLTGDLLGQARVPPPGRAVAAVGLKSGQYPPDLQPGNHVAVVVTPAGGTATGSASVVSVSAWNAVVAGVKPDSTEQVTVVSLQMAEADARQLAGTPAGQISVVMLGGGVR